MLATKPSHAPFTVGKRVRQSMSFKQRALQEVLWAEATPPRIGLQRHLSFSGRSPRRPRGGPSAPCLLCMQMKMLVLLLQVLEVRSGSSRQRKEVPRIKRVEDWIKNGGKSETAEGES